MYVESEIFGAKRNMGLNLWPTHTRVEWHWALIKSLVFFGFFFFALFECQNFLRAFDHLTRIAGAHKK